MKLSLTLLATLLVIGCSESGEEQPDDTSTNHACLPRPGTLEEPPTQGLPCSLIPPGLTLESE